MSWNQQMEMVCLGCGNEYTWDAATLTIANGNHGQCTKCGSENTKRKEWSEEKMTAIFGKNWRKHVNPDGTIKQ